MRNGLKLGITAAVFGGAAIALALTSIFLFPMLELSIAAVIMAVAGVVFGAAAGASND